MRERNGNITVGAEFNFLCPQVSTETIVSDTTTKCFYSLEQSEIKAGNKVNKGHR